MKAAKALGLTTTLALLALTLIGTSTAMAESTALCENTSLPCSKVFTGTIQAKAKNPELLTSIANVSCETSSFGGQALGLANPLVGHLTSFNFSGNCKTGAGTSCTVTSNALGLFLLLKTAPNQGAISFHELSFTVQCGFFINCVFSLPLTTELTMLGGSFISEGFGFVAVIHASKETLTNGGGFCPETAQWDGKYEVTVPGVLAISS